MIETIPNPDVQDLLDDRLEQLLEALGRRFPSVSLEPVQKAWRVACKAHAGQTRKSGEPYISHPLAVAEILAGFGLDPAAIAAALMHDVVEDTSISTDKIRKEFGDEIATLVQGVTKISEIEAREMMPENLKEAAAEAESLRRLLLATVDDLRVILIKLADRLHNMQTLGSLSPARRKRMALETLEIYAPLANRLGIWQFKSEFEDLALAELEPKAVEMIKTVLAGRQEEHDRLLSEAMSELEARLRETGVEPTLRTRAKHMHSIWRKMERKELHADEILDVLALRVLVDTIGDCYSALGVVHSLWQPIEGEFDDYIAKKKPNLYQSLHTTVLGPGKQPLEVQIRTKAMHEVAEYGVAAHWMYKENARLSEEVQEQIAALRRRLESHDEDAPDALAFVEGLKTDVFRDQVYVFTPRNRVIELPVGATPIDFAYHIHTEVGHRCRGATVDGRMVPLNTPLQTGQVVRIVTAKGDAVGPSRDWANPSLGFVVSNRGRAKIKQYFRRQAHGEAIRSGREVLEQQLRKLGMTKVKHERVAQLFGSDSLDDFLVHVGRQEITSQSITQRLLEAEAEAEAAARGDTIKPARRELPTARERPEGHAGVMVFGADEIESRVARCCNPLPGEPAVGHLTRSRGVTLHHAECQNIAKAREREPERFIQVEWKEKDPQTVPVELRIFAIDRSGLVRDITDVISRLDLHMTGFGAIRRDSQGMAIISAIVELGSHAQLVDLIDKLEAVKNVVHVRRPRG